jgi:hypothetical protein
MALAIDRCGLGAAGGAGARDDDRLVGRPAAWLADPRFGLPSGQLQRAQMVHQLQRAHGNAHVTRLIEHLPRSAAGGITRRAGGALVAVGRLPAASLDHTPGATAMSAGREATVAPQPSTPVAARSVSMVHELHSAADEGAGPQSASPRPGASQHLPSDYSVPLGAIPQGSQRRQLGSLAGNQRAAIQRDAKFGMMKQDQVSGFAGHALAFWRDNPNKTLEEFGAYLMDQVNVQLVANGVPRLPAPNLSSKRAAGGFVASSWTVEFDLQGTATHPLTAKISKLPADRISEVAGLFYHEGRHAEQAFLVARLVASEAKDPKDAKAIAAELDLPARIAEAALKATGPLPGGKEGLTKIRGWRAFFKGGKHQDYWDWNESLKKYVGNVTKNLPSPDPKDAPAIAAALDKLSPTLASWRKDTVPFATDKIAKLKGAKTRDAVDNQVLGNLTATRLTLKKVMDAETATIKQLDKLKARQEATAKKTKPRLAGAEAESFRGAIVIAWLDVRIALEELRQVTTKAYESYPGEADAYAAQHSVMKEITAKASRPPGKR